MKLSWKLEQLHQSFCFCMIGGVGTVGLQINEHLSMYPSIPHHHHHYHIIINGREGMGWVDFDIHFISLPLEVKSKNIKEKEMILGTELVWVFHQGKSMQIMHLTFSYKRLSKDYSALKPSESYSYQQGFNI